MITKDHLAAFADGELSPEEAAEVVMHLADHPGDQAYVDDLMAANAALSRAFSAPLGEPVPEPIRAAIMGESQGKVLPFRRRLATLTGLALAASVVGAVLLLPQGPFRQTVAPAFAPGPLAADSALLEAVIAQPSGQTLPVQGAELTILASLPIRDGHCREAELIDRGAGHLTVALICNRGEGWAVEVALSEPLPEDVTTIVPAGGDETEAIGLWLDRLGAGLALSPQAEAEAIAGGWTR